MTITLKRTFMALIALGMLGAGTAIAQRTDFNTLPYAQSFEDVTAWGGVNTNINITNGWYSTADDLSVFTNLTYTFTGCFRPLNSANHTKVLKLATEGATLTNDFTLNHDGASGFDMTTNLVYMDTMVQFVASEDQPASCTTADSGIKAAVYADVNTNLMIYHGVIDPSTAGWLSNVVENTGIPLDATNWYRLTIVFDGTEQQGAADLEMFQVRVNGVVVTNANAYLDSWKSDFEASNVPQTDPNGTWFVSGMTGVNRKKLTAIAFQGTGYIDDLAVSCLQPTYADSLGSYWLTVVRSANGASSLGAGTLAQVQIAAGASTTIVYTANDWYRIQTLDKDGSNVGAATNLKIYTQTLNSVAADISNNVTFYQLADVQNYNPAYSNVSPSWLAGWPGASEAGLVDNSPLTLNQEWLLNVNPYLAETAEFKVTGIAVTGTSVTVGVNLKTNSAQYASTLNGTLKLYGYATLGGAATSTNTSASLSGGVATYNFTDVNSNTFYKAVIE